MKYKYMTTVRDAQNFLSLIDEMSFYDAKGWELVSVDSGVFFWRKALS